MALNAQTWPSGCRRTDGGREKGTWTERARRDSRLVYTNPGVKGAIVLINSHPKWVPSYRSFILNGYRQRNRKIEGGLKERSSSSKENREGHLVKRGTHFVFGLSKIHRVLTNLPRRTDLGPSKFLFHDDKNPGSDQVQIHLFNITRYFFPNTQGFPGPGKLYLPTWGKDCDGSSNR